MPPIAQAPPSLTVCDSEDTEAGTEEDCYTQQINLLVAAREKDRKSRERKGKEQVGSQDGEKKERIGKDQDRGGERKDGVRKEGPRIVSNVQVAPALWKFHKERFRDEATTSAVSGSEAEWKVAKGGRRGRRNKSDKPPPTFRTDTAASAVRGAGAGTVGDCADRRPPVRQQPRVRLPRTPASSAVTITGRIEGFSYAAAMKNAREQINLETLGIKATDRKSVV